ncbi:MAG: cupin domain-containing protein [Cocleimonas sp.]|nr:cupin domain-containing protein [Cocleimonas sp.]
MNPTSKQKMLGGLSYQAFLSEYWQQKPLLVRQAFDGSPIDISAEELAGIACDTESPSRIVLENGNEPWESLFGPFDDDTFANLPESHWTLLVNDLERYFPELRQIMNKFHFIPNWRLDDLMLSYATIEGSVGPHTDEYDVFLIQTSGERKWHIDSKEDFNKETLENCALSILKYFDSDNDWILKPGDMLYLPPNMPHYGIAQDNDCMTLSVGFRAPSQRELIYNWVDSTINSPTFDSRYRDKERILQTNPAEISQYDIEQLSKIILKGLDSEKNSLSVWLGKYLTETKGDYALEEEGEKKQTSNHYKRKNWLRLAFIEDNQTIHFFAEGEHFLLDHEAKEAIHYLCNNYTYKKLLLDKFYQHATFKMVFNTLLQGNGIA